MEWIDPKTRLPKADEWVLCIHAHKRDNLREPFIGYMDEGGQWFSKDTGEKLNVLFWADIVIDNYEDL